jgi:hypothetical protein
MFLRWKIKIDYPERSRASPSPAGTPALQRCDSALLLLLFFEQGMVMVAGGFEKDWAEFFAAPAAES